MDTWESTETRNLKRISNKLLKEETKAKTQNDNAVVTVTQEVKSGNDIVVSNIPKLLVALKISDTVVC